MNVPILSIIVPIYNVESYLSECLTSIVAAFDKEFLYEIICVNDGSTDNSLSILEKFAQNTENIRIVDQQNAGYGRAINAGLEVARGSLVSIVESDDVIVPGVHQRIVAIFDQFPDVDFVKTPYQPWSPVMPRPIVSKPSPLFTIKNVLTSTDGFIHASGGVKHPLIVDFRNDTAILNAPSIWSGVYRRSSLIKNNITVIETPGASFQDTDFAFKCYLSGMKYIRICEHFYLYRVSRFDASRHNRKWGDEFINMLSSTRDFLVSNNSFGSEQKVAFYSAYFLRFVWYLERVAPGLRFSVFARVYSEFKDVFDHAELYISIANYIGSKQKDFLEFAKGNYRYFAAGIPASEVGAEKRKYTNREEFKSFLRTAYWKTPLIKKLAGENKESIRYKMMGLGLPPAILLADYYSKRNKQ